MTRIVLRGASPWLTLGEASLLLGVTPATLRRWTDGGDVAAFVTPGGHRRFARAAIEALMPRRQTHRPPVASSIASASRVARAYKRSKPAAAQVSSFAAAALSDPERADLRERGHKLLVLLLDHVNDERRPRPHPRMAMAVAEAGEYGRRAALLGAPLPEAIEAFVRFRSAFVGELATIARRRRLDTQEATALLVEAEAAVDRLLVALTSAYSAAS